MNELINSIQSGGTKWAYTGVGTANVDFFASFYVFACVGAVVVIVVLRNRFVRYAQTVRVNWALLLSQTAWQTITDEAEIQPHREIHSAPTKSNLKTGSHRTAYAWLSSELLDKILFLCSMTVTNYSPLIKHQLCLLY